eukprot:Skav215025  [mRNA]  locus=scaffold966:470229:471651:- [translate_table: standard]
MQLIAENGSVQRLDLPEDLKDPGGAAGLGQRGGRFPGRPGSGVEEAEDLYKTCWEIKQRRVLDLAADRGKYIDQSQSLTRGAHAG